MKSPLFSQSNGLTLIFLLLYGAGALVNLNHGKLMMATLWGLLFLINLGLLLVRLTKKK